MKLKAAITAGTNLQVVHALGSRPFAIAFLQNVIDECLGSNTTNRPGEFYVQKPDQTIRINDSSGVEVRLTGVSRGNRTPEQFQQALTTLDNLVADTIINALRESGSDENIQSFCVIMIDGNIQTAGGGYSNILESEPRWLTRESPRSK